MNRSSLLRYYEQPSTVCNRSDKDPKLLTFPRSAVQPTLRDSDPSAARRSSVGWATRVWLRRRSSILNRPFLPPIHLRISKHYGVAARFLNLLRRPPLS